MSTPYGVPQGDPELDALARILGTSFGQPAETMGARYEDVGLDNVRVLRRNGTVAGGLWLVPMGQFFGGKSVPMTGVAAVGVGPEYRGAGVALELMQSTIRELHESGIPLSSLYPATQTLYRKAGYEQTGYRVLVTVDSRQIQVKHRGPTVREASEADRDAVQTLYRRAAVNRNGHLDRGPYVWKRVFAFRDKPATGYLVEEDGVLTGYVYVVQKPADFGYDLMLLDLISTTPEAGRRLLSFLADHRSMSHHISWNAGPNDPTLALFSEQPYTIKHQLLWTTRIVDVPKALEARGYSPGMRTAVHLDVADDLIPENSGRFVLEVEDGRGRVRQGGEGHLRVSIRGMAPLYSGLYSPEQLRRADLLEGDDAACLAAAGVFASGTPWMPDMF